LTLELLIQWLLIIDKGFIVEVGLIADEPYFRVSLKFLQSLNALQPATIFAACPAALPSKPGMPGNLANIPSQKLQMHCCSTVNRLKPGDTGSTKMVIQALHLAISY
jgi:hypothetical protein